MAFRPVTAAGAAGLALLLPLSPAQAQPAAGPYGFTVTVSLSPKAAAKLKALGEGITVSSFYYGEMARKPTKAEIRRAERDGSEPGQIEIMGDRVTISGAGGVAEMRGGSVGAKDAAALGANPLKVNINVFTARLKTQDNLLACDLFDDDLSLARAKPIAIACKLIAEG